MLSSPLVDDRILDIAAVLAAHPVRSVEQHLGCDNNRLFHVLGADNQSYALKEYPRRANDARDRLDAEFAAFQFLERCGFPNVPMAIAADRAEGFALYEWIDGTPVADVADGDVDGALAFIARLHESRGVNGAGDLALASEACLSPMEIVAQVGRRFDSLNEVARGEPKLAGFLSQD